MADIEIRRLQAGEEQRFIDSVRIPFLDPATSDNERWTERWIKHLEVDRAWAAVDAGRFVGNCAIYSLDVSLPAGPGQPCPIVKMGGVTAVGVHPTHRRRGILTRLMAEMLSDGRARNEPVAGLIASESLIYGRFGFGLATESASVTIDSEHAQMYRPAPELDLELIDVNEAVKVLPDLYDRHRRTRPGEVHLSPVGWENRLADDPDDRRGSSGLMIAVCDEGYVAYRAKRDEEPATLIVENLRGLTDEVEAGLWQYVFDIDLARTVTSHRRPVDEPLRWRLVDPRQLKMTLDDHLWVRVLDVAAAFEARGYASEGRLVFDVAAPPVPLADDAVPGRWVLEAGADGAICRAAGAGEEADIRLDVTALGALYLGGFPASALAAAGRISEVRPGGVAVADRLLRSHRSPLTVTGF
ncbi:MAG TPA: GNAT family N-acetyltransferase [Acidimicrobiales bacterium]|jgi:predicted acetyltransferase|nr:GNAT family N-acetyltransferase [Acidimicrobiales bacterium]